MIVVGGAACGVRARPGRPMAPVSPLAPVSKALAAVLIPAETFGSSAVGVTDTELQNGRGASCSFLDEDGQALNCRLEGINIGRIRKWINAKATVLELGAQYGMTSCEIAKVIQNSGRLMTIEPNPRVWSALHRNLRSHNCSAHVLQGGLQRGGTAQAQALVDYNNNRRETLHLLHLSSSHTLPPPA